MRAGRSRAPWCPHRQHTVRPGTEWRLRGRSGKTVWWVAECFRFEAGAHGEMLAVRVTAIRGVYAGLCRHMSEARFLRLFVPFGNGDYTRSRGRERSKVAE